MNVEGRYSIIFILGNRLSAAIPHFIIRYFLFDIRYSKPTQPLTAEAARLIEKETTKKRIMNPPPADKCRSKEFYLF
jgi:hypothetical protein